MSTSENILNNRERINSMNLIQEIDYIHVNSRTNLSIIIQELENKLMKISRLQIQTLILDVDENQRSYNQRLTIKYNMIYRLKEAFKKTRDEI